MNYISAFTDYLEYEKNYSEMTISSYDKDLKEFLSFYNGDLSEVIKNDITNYLKFLYDKNNSKTTVSRKISTLKSFYKFMALKGFIKDNPVDMVSFPRKEKKLPNYVTEGELGEVIDTSLNRPNNERDNLIIELLYATGVRVSELCNIKLSDIDFSNKTIRILGKGSYERIVYFGDYAYDALNKYINGERCKILDGKDNNFLFVSRSGAKISDRSVRYILDNIVSKSNINKNVSPHTMRHTFATHLLNNGCDVKTVQQFLGHKHLATTEVYTHVSSERLKSVYKQAHPRATDNNQNQEGEE